MVSALSPKACWMRTAISPERLARPLRKADKAGRETPRTLAAAVTDRPRGSIISERMKSPGCDGLNIRISLFPSMIIFEIQVADFVILNPKCNAPISGDVKAPSFASIACEEMRLPPAEGVHF